MLNINTPVGIMRAPVEIEETTKNMSDAEIINQIDTEHFVDPFVFTELLNRGLYGQTADCKRQQQREKDMNKRVMGKLKEWAAESAAAAALENKCPFCLIGIRENGSDGCSECIPF